MRVNKIMGANDALLNSGIELLKLGAFNNGLDGRTIRLTGHALFALARAGSTSFVDPDVNKEWLKAVDDMERDGLSQTLLRDKVIEFRETRNDQFKAIFSGKSSLPLFRAAIEFFRDVNKQRLERDRIVRFALCIACLVIAEERYSIFEKCSMREQIERNSALKLVTGNSVNYTDFESLITQFKTFQKEYAENRQFSYVQSSAKPTSMSAGNHKLRLVKDQS